MEPLVSIFQLHDTGRGPPLAHMHWLHQEGKFKELTAVMLGTKLRLQPELDVEKDKANLVEHYVDGFPDLQRRLLALMDSWCQSGCDIRVVARRYPQATAWRLERLSPERWCSRSCACCSATAWTQNCVPMRPPCGTCATCGRVEVCGSQLEARQSGPRKAAPALPGLPLEKLCLVSLCREAHLGRAGSTTCGAWWGPASGCRSNCCSCWPPTATWPRPPAVPWTLRCRRSGCRPQWPRSSAG